MEGHHAFVQVPLERGVPTAPVPTEGEADKKRKQLLQVFQQSTRPTFDVEEATLLRRLRREAQVLSASDPWTVLGVPRSATLHTVEHVVERMVEHYKALRTHAHPEVRHLADSIGARVEAALAEVRDTTDRPDSIPGLQEGMTLVQRAEWTQADRYFSALHQKHLDSVPVLTWLGWSRYMNAQRPAQVRKQEGREFLQLALQFDASNADAHAHLARVLYEDGDLAGAARHAVAAVKFNPSHVGARNLVQKLKGRKA